jgi:hypothetical protein
MQAAEGVGLWDALAASDAGFGAANPLYGMWQAAAAAMAAAPGWRQALQALRGEALVRTLGEEGCPARCA